MRAFSLVVRFLAFVFNLVLGLGLFFLALMVTSSGKHNIDLAVVPLTGSKLTYTVLIASIYCFVSMVLALRKSRWARFPMVLWNLTVSVLLLWTPLRASFSFQNPDEAKNGFYMLLASLMALCGSWLQWRSTLRAGNPTPAPRYGSLH